MLDQTKKDIEFHIKNNHQAIKDQRPKIALKNNPNLLENIKRKDINEINNLLNTLQNQNNELIPFIKAIKTKIPDITAQTHLCAVYLLLCLSLQTWQSLFLLAKNGFYSQIMTIIRMIEELTMLSNNFTLEFKNNSDEALKKWFSGIIISHGIGRDAVSQFIEEGSTFQNIDTKQLQAHIYKIESLTPHCAYGSLLENISPFTEDFDFEGFTGFRRTTSMLRCAIGPMSSFTITLKGVYLILLNDHDSYNKIDQILLKYDPAMREKVISKNIQEIFKK